MSKMIERTSARVELSSRYNISYQCKDELKNQSTVNRARVVAVKSEETSRMAIEPRILGIRRHQIDYAQPYGLVLLLLIPVPAQSQLHQRFQNPDT